MTAAHMHAGTIKARSRDSLLASPTVGHKIEFICDNCDKPFKAYASQRPRPLKFCKSKCGFEYAKKTHGFRVVETADIESDVPPRPTEPKYLVVYDPIKKELRNKADA